MGFFFQIWLISYRVSLTLKDKCITFVKALPLYLYRWKRSLSAYIQDPTQIIAVLKCSSAVFCNSHGDLQPAMWKNKSDAS